MRDWYEPSCALAGDPMTRAGALRTWWLIALFIVGCGEKDSTATGAIVEVDEDGGSRLRLKRDSV